MKIGSTVRNLGNDLSTCIKRFPIVVTFVVALSIHLIMLASPSDEYRNLPLVKTLTCYLAAASILSLTLRLWDEDHATRKQALIANIAAHALLVADAILLYCQLSSQASWIESYLPHIALIAVLTLSVFVLPFFKQKDDIPAWNFTANTIISGMICALVGQVMAVGINLLLYSVHTLFGTSYEFQHFMTTEVLCGLLLPVILLLGRIPQGRHKYNQVPLDSTFFNAVVRFLIVPLVSLYLLILYIYTTQIVVTWKLPDGWISNLVTISMAGLIAIEFGIYPVRKLQNKAIDNRIAKWLPALMLPLILLMTVGIIRRVSDYGITVMRLYLITLNLWFYAVCIILLITKARRITWIVTSFVVILFITSVLPVNYASCTRSYMQRKVEQVMKGMKLPISTDEYPDFLKTLSKEEATTLNMRLQYLAKNYDYAANQYVKASGEHLRWGYFSNIYLADSMIAEPVEDEHAYIRNYMIDIPDGFKHIVDIQSQSTKYDETDKIIEMEVKNDSITYDTFIINIDTIRAHFASEDYGVFKAESKSGMSLLYINDYDNYASYDRDNDSTHTYCLRVGGLLIQKTGNKK